MAGEHAGLGGVGLGLNVANPLPPDARWTATRLAEYDAGLTPRPLAEPVAQAIACD